MVAVPPPFRSVLWIRKDCAWLLCLVLFLCVFCSSGSDPMCSNLLVKQNTAEDWITSTSQAIVPASNSFSVPILTSSQAPLALG